MNTEIKDGILTFDELLEDEYYSSEFEKRVQERLNIKNSLPDVKGGTETMDGIVQKPEGEVKEQGAAQQPESQPTNEATPAPAENPAAENTTATTEIKEETPKQEEPAKEMTAQQFEQYNETLRRVSKTAKAGLPGRYNAFEDAEVKALVKQQIMAGETPSVKEIAAGVVTRLTPAPEPKPEEPKTQNTDAEVLSLKAENALLKAGINPERIDAATKLFIAEGGDLGKVPDFVAKYPEWGKSEQGVVFTKAAPVSGKTAPNPTSQPVLNDFEKKVAAARKARGLDT